MFEVIDARNDIVEKPAAALAPFASALRYDRVSFDYGEGPVLVDADQTIRRGETVASSARPEPARRPP